MRFKNCSKLFIAGSMAGIMLLTSSAVKAAENKNVIPQTTAISVILAQAQTTPQHLTAIERITNVIDRAKFDMFKTHLENGLRHTAKVIPQLKQKNAVLPQSVNQDVATIESTLPAIKAAKTPEEVIKPESTAFNSAISALRTINSTNQNAQTKSSVASRLDSAETMTKSLTSTNYKVETKRIFQAINYSMKELHRSLK